MKSLIDLTPEESKGLDGPLLDNAIKLKEDSKLLATEKKSFSTATSLLILSSEELIKAILVLLHSEGYKVYQLEDASKFFKDHKIRHQIWQLIETGYGFFEAKEAWNTSKLNFESNKTVFGSVLSGVYAGYKAYKPLSKSMKRVEKLQGFNDLKNKGLYVDFWDEIYIPKIVVTEKDYLGVTEIVERLFKFYEKVEMLFQPKADNQMSTTKIEKLKGDLKILINHSLNEFSFKELNK